MSQEDLMSTAHYIRVSLVAVAVLLYTWPAAALVPGQVNYQGLLLDSAGDPVSSPSRKR